MYLFNRSWVDTRWQQHITHLLTNCTPNTEKGKLGIVESNLDETGTKLQVS
jgi:hypothetical protein